MSTNSMLIDSARNGNLLPPATPGSPARVIQIAEIYPYHVCRYPDQGDLETNLSTNSGTKPHQKLLQQTLCALEVHKNSFTVTGPTPESIMNLAASLSLEQREIPMDDPRNSIQNGLMYLNKILETSPYLRIHQFLFDAYCACTVINEHVMAAFRYPGAAKDTKEAITSVYESLLKWEVQVKEENDSNQTPRSTNTATVGQRAVGQSTGSDPYNILGIVSLEKGGNRFQWRSNFEDKLNRLLKEYGLVLNE
ncbi:hypothetical protein N431DRAFT_331452 [Stipitochalara longipes BDJ]|nr:hypothetical protein N431DRAFT_331452 [Stipitochalara longipes BDJ]